MKKRTIKEAPAVDNVDNRVGICIVALMFILLMGKLEAYYNTGKYLECAYKYNANIQLCKDVYLK